MTTTTETMTRAQLAADILQHATALDFAQLLQLVESADILIAHRDPNGRGCGAFSVFIDEKPAEQRTEYSKRFCVDVRDGWTYGDLYVCAGYDGGKTRPGYTVDVCSRTLDVSGRATGRAGRQLREFFRGLAERWHYGMTPATEIYYRRADQLQPSS